MQHARRAFGQQSRAKSSLDEMPTSPEEEVNEQADAEIEEEQLADVERVE